MKSILERLDTLEKKVAQIAETFSQREAESKELYLYYAAAAASATATFAPLKNHVVHLLNEHGDFALHVACERGDADTVLALLNHGAFVVIN